MMLFAIALSLRVFYVLEVPQGKLVGDAYEYDTIAWHLVQGAGYSIEQNIPASKRAPGFPFMLALIYFMFGHSYAAVTVFQSLIGAATCILIYYIARMIYDERVARASGLLMCFYPIIIAYTNLILSETLFIFLFSSTIFLFMKSDYGEKRIFLLASGFFLGLTTLTRATTVLYPFVLALVIFLVKTRKPVLKSAMVFAVFIISMIPWTARNYREFNIILPVCNGGGINIYYTAYMACGYTFEEAMDVISTKYERLKTSHPFCEDKYKKFVDIQLDKVLKKEGMQLIRDNIGRYSLLVVRRPLRLWWSSFSSVLGVDRPLRDYVGTRDYMRISVRVGLLAFHAAVLLLALVGMYKSLQVWKTALLLLMTILYFNMHILFDFCNRLVLPVYPYLFIFAVAGIYYLKDNLSVLVVKKEK